MFQINPHANPSILQPRDDTRSNAANPEVLLRRELLKNALAGNQQARATLRNSYHLTRWMRDGREALPHNHKERRKNRHAR